MDREKVYRETADAIVQNSYFEIDPRTEHFGSQDMTDKWVDEIDSGQVKIYLQNKNFDDFNAYMTLGAFAGTGVGIRGKLNYDRDWDKKRIQPGSSLMDTVKPVIYETEAGIQEYLEETGRDSFESQIDKLKEKKAVRPSTVANIHILESELGFQDVLKDLEALHTLSGKAKAGYNNG